MKGLEEEKERMLASNCALAQENVDKEPEIIEKKSRISDLAAEGTELCSAVQEKLNLLSECLKGWNVRCIEFDSFYSHQFQNPKKATPAPKQHWHCCKQKRPNVRKHPKNSSRNWQAKNRRLRNFWTPFWTHTRRCIYANWKWTKWRIWFGIRMTRLGVAAVVVVAAPDPRHILIFTEHQAEHRTQRGHITCLCQGYPVCQALPGTCTDSLINGPHPLLLFKKKKKKKYQYIVLYFGVTKCLRIETRAIANYY